MFSNNFNTSGFNSSSQSTNELPRKLVHSQSMMDFRGNNANPGAAPTNSFGLQQNPQLSAQTSQQPPQQPPQAINNFYPQSSTNSPSYNQSHYTPSPHWARPERRIMPSHLSVARKNKNEIEEEDTFRSSTRSRNGRGTSSKPSSNSSTNSSRNSFQTGYFDDPDGPPFGTSFGTPKPMNSKKESILDVSGDIPPVESIYDSTFSPFQARYNSDNTASSGSTSTTSNTSLRRKSSSSKDREFGGLNFDPATPTQTSIPENHEDTSGLTRISYKPNSVIVLGYPPSLTIPIIQHFSKFGTILEKVGPQANSPLRRHTKLPKSPQVQSGKNWIRLTYADPQGAARALQENGALFGGGYAIGCVEVTPYNEDQYSLAGERTMLEDIKNESNNLMDIDFDPSLNNSHKKREEINRNISKYENQSSNTTTTTTNKIISSDIPPAVSNTNLPRTISMPALKRNSTNTPNRRLEIHSNKNIFSPKPRSNRMAFLSSFSPHKTVEETAQDNDAKKIKSRESWLKWSTKKAQEIVFGWDDL